MRRCPPVALTLAIALIAPACGPAATLPSDAADDPDLAASVTTVTIFFPILIDVLIPCANGGAGETATISGTLHEVFHFTFDGRGGGHFVLHDNPQGIRGVGQVTGSTYQGTGVTRSSSNFRVGSADTFVNNFRMIGQGPGNNLLVHQNSYITISAQGEVSVRHDNFSAECR